MGLILNPPPSSVVHPRSGPSLGFLQGRFGDWQNVGNQPKLGDGHMVVLYTSAIPA